MIGTLNYKKILKTGNGVKYIAGPPNCPPWCPSNYHYYYYDRLYYGGMRQNTSQKKVYFIPPWAAQEELLYDFDLNLGDTLVSSYINYLPNYVSAIDSTLIGNNYHQRFWLSYGSLNNYINIVEGIGGSMGLLSELIPPFEMINTLICVTINSIPVYPDTATICELASEINEIPAPQTSIVLSPNPATDFINITNSFTSPMQITVFSAYGAVVHRTTLAKDARATIDLSAWADGIYLVTAQSGKNFVSRKVIKH